MSLVIIICLLVVIVITGLFLFAINTGYRVKHTIDEISHGPNITESKKDQN
ncbi:YtzI protein [Solibacillus sp. R5-41]|uniref:YtzI protein n=1 Tax=Solibacillus sp. R5-41 TaxID=2048654 RepID=UPI0020A607BC|nr:YtzI protein [Solibacillus sp. R5-41]